MTSTQGSGHERDRQPVVFVQGGGDMHHPRGQRPLAKYLDRDLGGAYRVIAPEMPDADNPRYGPWRDEIQRVLDTLEGPVLLVGHSIGGSVLVKLLAERPFEKPITGLFLVAVPYWAPGHDWDWDEFNLPADFATRLPETKVFLYQSQDDPEVPIAHLGRYHEALPAATARAVAGSRHSFVDGLPELVRDIEGLASRPTGA